MLDENRAVYSLKIEVEETCNDLVFKETTDSNWIDKFQFNSSDPSKIKKMIDQEEAKPETVIKLKNGDVLSASELDLGIDGFVGNSIFFEEIMTKSYKDPVEFMA